ncbi:MAG TPA: hypothetical protein VF585_06960, partial [Chthoniobacterales bacterium]
PNHRGTSLPALRRAAEGCRPAACAPRKVVLVVDRTATSSASGGTPESARETRALPEAAATLLGPGVAISPE